MSKVRVLFALVPVLVLGCSPFNPNAPAKVHGTVTYNGKPVTGGTITLYTEGAGTREATAAGGIYTLPIAPDGTYSGTDLPAGTMAVTIETESVNPHHQMPQYGRREGKSGQTAAGPAGQEMVRQGAGGMGSPLPASAGHVRPGEYIKIPAKYANVKTSGLTVTLERGNQQKDFNLTD